MSTPSVTTTDSSAHAVKERLARLEQDLIRKRKRLDATTTLTVIVGIIILLAIGGYSWWGYNQVSIFKDPDKIADMAAQTIDENLPQLRRRLETEINQSAPEWASGLSKQALGYLPAGRQQFEKLVMENLDDGLAQTREKTNEQFRTFITKHKEDLDRKFKELAKSPDLADTTFADMYKDLEDDLGLSFQADAAALLKELKAANQSFKKLRDGNNLNEQQQLERECWMLARAIVNREKLDLSTTGLPEVSKASTTNPVSIKNPGGAKPRKPIQEDDNKVKDSEKKKDAGSNSEKKNDAAADGNKKKDSEKPDSKN